jgi:hypothetical protein
VERGEKRKEQTHDSSGDAVRLAESHTDGTGSEDARLAESAAGEVGRHAKTLASVATEDFVESDRLAHGESVELGGRMERGRIRGERQEELDFVEEEGKKRGNGEESVPQRACLRASQ